MGQRETIRVTVRLDAEHDADLIAWLDGIPPGSRVNLRAIMTREITAKVPSVC